jgi:hypothetical protein
MPLPTPSRKQYFLFCLSDFLWLFAMFANTTSPGYFSDEFILLYFFFENYLARAFIVAPTFDQIENRLYATPYILYILFHIYLRDSIIAEGMI